MITRAARAPCAGSPVGAPDGLSWTDGLIWALGHPDGDRAVVAARTLGGLKARRGGGAAASAETDVYLRAEALRSLIAIEGAEALRPWLEQLSRDAPLMIRDIARKALGEPLGAIARPERAGSSGTGQVRRAGTSGAGPGRAAPPPACVEQQACAG